MLYSHLRAKAHLVRDIASVDAAQTEVFVGNGSLQKEVSRKATFGWLFALNAAPLAKSTCNKAINLTPKAMPVLGWPSAIVIQYRLHFARRL